jgi:hypothetical protein
LRGRYIRFRQIPRRADNVRAVRRKRPRSLNAQSGRNAGNENSLAVEIYSG